MTLKLFPKVGTERSGVFSTNDVLRIRGMFTTWVFPGSHLFGPYELLDFTLVGPYEHCKKQFLYVWLVSCRGGKLDGYAGRVTGQTGYFFVGDKRVIRLGWFDTYFFHKQSIFERWL